MKSKLLLVILKVEYFGFGSNNAYDFDDLYKSNLD